MSKEMIKDKSLNLGLKYYGGIFDEDELQLHLQNLKNYNINLSKYDQNGIVMAAIEPSTISVFISNPFVQSYLSGLLASATWSAFLGFIVWATKFKKDKKLYKATPNKVEEIEPTFGLNIDVGDNRKIDFQISGELTDEQKTLCIISAFEFIKSIPPLKKPSIEIAIYNIENNTWKIINLIDEAKKRKNNTI